MFTNRYPRDDILDRDCGIEPVSEFVDKSMLESSGSIPSSSGMVPDNPPLT